MKARLACEACRHKHGDTSRHVTWPHDATLWPKAQFGHFALAQNGQKGLRPKRRIMRPGQVTRCISVFVLAGFARQPGLDDVVLKHPPIVAQTTVSFLSTACIMWRLYPRSYFSRCSIDSGYAKHVAGHSTCSRTQHCSIGPSVYFSTAVSFNPGLLECFPHRTAMLRAQANPPVLGHLPQPQ